MYELLYIGFVANVPYILGDVFTILHIGFVVDVPDKLGDVCTFVHRCCC